MTRPLADHQRSELSAALEAARAREIPEADACLAVARAYLDLEEPRKAASWCARVVDSGFDYRSWTGAARLLRRIGDQHELASKRAARLAIVGSYTTNQLVDLLRLAGARRGIALDIYEAGFGLYQQEVLDPNSGLYAHDPDLILIAVHEGEIRFPPFSDEPETTVEAEASKWASLWSRIAERSKAKVIQTNFAQRPERTFGHLSSRLEGARSSMMTQLNAQLGNLAGEEVAILDCDYLSSLIGKSAWFDDRYWHVSKQAVSLGALPLMAQHATALIAAELGLTRKCLVLDLDGTLWGGIIGEDGVEGIRLGHGVEGEAFVAFQQYLLNLKNRGVVLAVCSKNDERTARTPFERHPDMRLSLEDFGVFVANWQPKPENLTRIARSLDLGLDSMVFVDDQADQRESVRQALPDVDVIVLPEDAAGYVSAVADYPFFELASFTTEDSKRTETYRARSAAYELKEQSQNIEEFLESLEMRATLGTFDEFHLPRITQLVGKTNQFNLTTRRHSGPALKAMMDDPNVIDLYMKLEDRFGDHGLIGVVVGKKDGEAMEIDTLLMSCRVIGRTAESVMVGEVAKKARELGCSSLRGVYRRTERNNLVADLYGSLGFEKLAESDDITEWSFELDQGEIGSDFISVDTK